MLQRRSIVIALLLIGCSLIASANVNNTTAVTTNEKANESQKEVTTISEVQDLKVNPSSVPSSSMPDVSPNEPPSRAPEATHTAPTNVMPPIVQSPSAPMATISKPDATSSEAIPASSESDTTPSKSETTPTNAPTTPKITSPKPEPVPVKPETTITPEPDTSSSTQSTTTKTTPTTSSTTSTTSTSSTTSTTSAPSTTTTKPKPKPYPQPSIGHWNSSCIMVKMAAQLNITYLTSDKKNATALYNVPSNATVNDSNCMAVTQMIQISWGSAEAENSMLLQFDLKEKTSELTMLRFVIAIVGDDFPNALENQTISMMHRGKDFAAPLEMSYHCTRSQTFNLTETVGETKVVSSVTVHDVQVEAFRKANSSSNFSAVHDCDGADTPDIVPIAVGIALVAMIMIILTSYLCARRRSNLRGYMSF